MVILPQKKKGNLIKRQWGKVTVSPQREKGYLVHLVEYYSEKKLLRYLESLEGSFYLVDATKKDSRFMALVLKDILRQTFATLGAQGTRHLRLCVVDCEMRQKELVEFCLSQVNTLTVATCDVALWQQTAGQMEDETGAVVQVEEVGRLCCKNTLVINPEVVPLPSIQKCTVLGGGGETRVLPSRCVGLELAVAYALYQDGQLRADYLYCDELNVCDKRTLSIADFARYVQQDCAT